MTRPPIALIAAAALVASACAGSSAHRDRAGDPREDLVTDRTADGPDGDDHRLSGEASWYGDKFHGRQTASGEIYDMNAFTAAHKTLPFHTIVRVVDPLTRKSVVVRINDRGPYVDGRIIDLSRAAASDLGLVRHGVIPVELEVLRWGDGSRVDPGDRQASN